MSCSCIIHTAELVIWLSVRPIASHFTVAIPLILIMIGTAIVALTLPSGTLQTTGEYRDRKFHRDVMKRVASPQEWSICIKGYGCLGGYINGSNPSPGPYPTLSPTGYQIRN